MIASGFLIIFPSASTLDVSFIFAECLVDMTWTILGLPGVLSLAPLYFIASIFELCLNTADPFGKALSSGKSFGKCFLLALMVPTTLVE